MKNEKRHANMAWDTQSDMLYATMGAIFMLLLFSKIQDKLISTHQTNSI